jgi:hypothetical protein
VTQLASSLDKIPTLVAAILTAVGIGVLVAWQLASEGTGTDDWDYLVISGCLTTLAGLWLARGQRERFEATYERLGNRKALKGNPRLTRGKLEELKAEIRERALKWSLATGIAFGLGIPVVWVVVNATREGAMRGFDEIAGPLVGAIGGFLVGRVLGRMLSYGMLGPFLKRRGVTFTATPGHVDGAAGLKPLGDYYLYQALLLALPAVFLLFWSLMFQLPKWGDRYAGWREAYLALLALAIVIEIAAFIAPMWHAHVAMKAAKREACNRDDTTVAREIAEVRALLERDLSPEGRANAQDRLDYLTARYEATETMPTWPIDRALRRRVTLGNAGLIVGLVAQVTALTGWS